MNQRSTRAALPSVAVTLGTAALAVAAAVAVKYALLLLTGENAGFTIYIPAVALAAWYRGMLGGAIATALGALADSILFTPPLLVSAIDMREYTLRLTAFVAGGMAVSYLSFRLRRERTNAQREAAERRRALEDAAAVREELGRVVAAERRAAELREAFNSIVSHELRTPITAIYGGAKILARRDRVMADSTRQELLDDLEEEADRLYRLVEDLLVLSRSERGTVERADDPVLVQRIVERVIRSEGPRWPQVTFESETAMAPTARGDETYVEQVLRNLLSNAAKYSPAGSAVRVIVDESSEGVRVRVLDEGAGIDPGEAARLFELYYRSPATSGKVAGAGIGLYVCRALVEAMGGRIWAAPRSHGGAEFGFILSRFEDS
jgi:K+-sensing histidine kinase KdpD